MQTVLVVDDSSFITEGLASILKKNYRTIISSGGEMCLEVLKKETPDIIILDILMEPMDGWETLLHIRQNPATRHIPVIMFSAKKISPFEAETHHPYIDEYITKPVSPRNLLDTIAKVLSRKEASQKTLRLWKQAGLQAEEIEEYARLMTSIEVDEGICSNMQQQLITERRDSPVGEIRRSVEIIGSRIQKNSLLVEEIARKGELLVAAYKERAGVPDTDIPDTGGDDSGQNGSALTIGPVSNPVNLPASPQNNVPARAEDPQAKRGAVVPDPAGKKVPEDGFGGMARLTPHPAEKTAPLSSQQDSTDNRDKVRSPLFGRESAAVSAGTPAQQNRPAAGISESLFEEEPEPAGRVNATPQQPDRVQAPPAGGQQTHSERIPVPEMQPEVQATIQPSRDTSTPARQLQKVEEGDLPPAKGTRAIPMKKDTIKKTPPENTPPAPGFFGRIIQAILSLFSRSK